jgi:hypothetical protein
LWHFAQLLMNLGLKNKHNPALHNLALHNLEYKHSFYKS